MKEDAEVIVTVTTLELCIELYHKYGITTTFDADRKRIIHGKEGAMIDII